MCIEARKLLVSEVYYSNDTNCAYCEGDFIIILSREY